MIKRTRVFRSVTVTKEDGREGKYSAQVIVETNIETGAVVFKVVSQVLPKRCAKFRGSGNQAADQEHLMKLCQDMYEFDRGYGPRPVPKPGGGKRKGSTRMAIAPTCTKCGGDGWYVDETGYEFTCECRGKYADF